MGAMTTYDHFKLLQTEGRFEVKVDGSCISNCGKGPNVWVTERIYNGVSPDDVSLFSAILEIEVGGPSEPPLILAAVEAYVGLISADSQRLPPPSAYDDIIDVLKTSKFTYALASALISRAECQSQTSLDLALEDSLAATSCCPSHPRGYRVLSEIYQAGARTKDAIEALKKHYDNHPELPKTKLKNEISELT
ncbi:hypothetical protein TrRE_jg12092 [Triparma retinervis]|uniref:Uncharacterized protein n=1 Tax=Triparma retinervis TaxID=2557542 RepID=A0A9W7L3V2_9STRA|nr:hypothetical protein TrRE_jg12092 [Triparma retinervis]